MESTINSILEKYTKELINIYGEHIKSVILYGSYARGDNTIDSDIDIMILLDISDLEIKEYRKELSYMTYDYNMDYDIDIKPIAKNKEHFEKWLEAYPFYANVKREGVELYEAA